MAHPLVDRLVYAEAAHETAASGQASSMPAGDQTRAVDALDRHGGALQVIARAIVVVVRDAAAESSPEKPS